MEQFYSGFYFGGVTKDMSDPTMKSGEIKILVDSSVYASSSSLDFV